MFEQGVKHLVPLRRVELRDGCLRAVPSAEDDGVTLDVPTSGAGRIATLRAGVDPAHRLNDWDHQTLTSLAHLGALIVEIDHLGHTRPSGTGAMFRADGAAPLIGSSQAMRVLRERIERVAATDFCVLIEGESGTGKELVARHVHDFSRRSCGPFVAINCAALVETLLEAELFGIEDRTATGVRGRRGKFEYADGGTLFLDEVSDLSLSAQAKLLRAIQDLSVERVGGCGTRRVDTRIVVATNRSLAELVERGLFRPDLFYRLCGVEIRVPPLRARREDILELATYFLARHRSMRKLELAAGAIEALKLYDWPGNVRELERFVEGAVALAHGDRIDLDDLPPAIRGEYAEVLLPSLMCGESMRAWGSRYARLVLERCAHNKRQACRRLGISYHTLQAYLRYRPAGARAPGAETLEWPEEEATDMALCRVPAVVESGLSRSALQAVLGMQDI
jgi:transcriptional regulator with PAS, ATPase and Fis domain